MKRSLLLSLCATAVVAMSVGQATAANVNLILNLRYTDPNNESAGGTWQLKAKTDDANGISAIVAVLDGISAPTLAANIGAIPIETKTSGTITEFVYGQDPAGTTVAVGVGSGLSNVAKDVLFSGAANAYDNMSLIATGSFGATRPSFATYPGAGTGGVTDAAVWADAGRTVAAAGPETIVLGGGDGVRGDSVATDGLRPGDANRDGTVNLSDFTILGSPANYNQPGGWDQGDFNSDGQVGLSDFTILGSPANYNTSAASPAIGAVPEPSSIALVMFSLASLVGVRRR
ncbi:PEP-CTERM sorting domain-containing protein [Bythopirellula goksoeyrii]|nr:PEP-CTERM sorting domain-containing protein [Bythopirellula goksoeyrii]